jgi:hypothetical protein
MNVKGIGEGKFAQIADQITVDGGKTDEDTGG